MLTFETEVLQELGLGGRGVLRVGYYFIENSGVLGYWTPSGTGSLRYEGALELNEVVSTLNAKAKEIYGALTSQARKQEGESTLEAVSRLRREANLSLQSAKKYVEEESLFGNALLIKGGPLKGKCCLVDGGIYQYLPEEVLGIIPFNVENLEFPEEEEWELLLSYKDGNQYIFLYMVSEHPHYTIEDSYSNFRITRKDGNLPKDLILRGSHKECLRMQDLLRTAFHNGKSSVKNQAKAWAEGL